MLARAFGDECISVTGAMSPEEKAYRIEAWMDGAAPVLVTKVPIAGFGLNLQRASKMAFVGLSDSYESYYQAVRRCWRFGQDKPVKAYVVLSEIERTVFDNVLRKEAEAEAMSRELVKHVAAYERAEIEGASLGDFNDRHDLAMAVPAWLGGTL